jgi:hypothetical protein
MLGVRYATNAQKGHGADARADRHHRGGARNICITTQRHSRTLNGTQEVPSIRLKP